MVKYISRAGKKDLAKTIEDLKKARWYLDRYIGVLSAAEIETDPVATKNPLAEYAEEMRESFCKKRASQNFCEQCQIGRNAEIEQISCQQWVEFDPERAIGIMRKAVG